MNWRVGLLRAWVFFSALWLVAIASLGAHDWYTDVWEIVPPKITRTPTAAEIAGCEKKTPGASWCKDPLVVPAGPPQFVRDPPRFAFWLPAAFLPPIILMGLGLGAAWVVRSFRRKT
jgi:hypothetical protein